MFDRIPVWVFAVALWSLMTACIAGAVAGCSEGVKAAAAAAAAADAAGLAYYVDPETGCQYVSPRYSYKGIVPRSGADGKHMGCRGLQ